MLGVLGGGLTGLTLASRVPGALVLEAEDSPGGLCRSLTFDGFTFDPHGSHILFSRRPEAMAFYRDLLGDNVCERRRNTKVFYKGRHVKYPFENGLSDLPPEENLECLLGFLQAYLARRDGSAEKPTNFLEWMYYRFGSGITEKYLLPYNRKIWKTDPREMGIDWVDGRVPDPPLEDVVKSSLGIPTEGYTHQLQFLYPRRGGVQSLIDGLLPRVSRVETGFVVREIRRRGEGWIVSDGARQREFRRLVSTIPIPALTAAVEDAPEDVKRAGSRLIHRSLVSVMLGIRRPNLNDLSWLYFPRPEEGLFNRVSFPSNFSDRSAPPGMSSAMAEITCDFRDDVWSRPDEALIEHVVDKLVGFGMLRREDVVASRVGRTRYAYVVFDQEHRKNLDAVHAWAREVGIEPLGRFGQFDYINTDQCILRGLDLAKRLGGDA